MNTLKNLNYEIIKSFPQYDKESIDKYLSKSLEKLNCLVHIDSTENFTIWAIIKVINGIIKYLYCIISSLFYSLIILINDLDFK